MIEALLAQGAKFNPKSFTGLINELYYGNVFYVDSNNGSDTANPGTAPDQALASLDMAVGKCTANHGDVIILMPGHAETVTSSNTTLDVAGITIIGVGNGLKRPTFTYGAAAATINVSAANIVFKNCHFIGNFDNVAAAFTVAGDDFVLENNTFVDNSNALHFLSIVVTSATDNAADGLVVRGNSWYGLALAPNAFVSLLAALSHVIIEKNYVNMAATNDVGHFVTLADKVLTNLRIIGNTCIVTGAANATVGVFLTGSGTSNGIVANNYCASLDTTTELFSTASTALKFFENYYTGTADASGKLWPAVDGA